MDSLAAEGVIPEYVMEEREERLTAERESLSGDQYDPTHMDRTQDPEAGTMNTAVDHASPEPPINTTDIQMNLPRPTNNTNAGIELTTESNDSSNV